MSRLRLHATYQDAIGGITAALEARRQSRAEVETLVRDE